MDAEPEDHQRAFRTEVRRWLREHVPTSPLPPIHTEEGVCAHRAWERELLEGGYAALHWPREFGGADAGLVAQAIFQEEYLLADGPQRLNRLGLGLVGPTIIEFGTEAQKRRWLPGILSCEELWCQGFSEPDAGSDLAAVRTRAERDGEDLVVNGQKIWTSLATFADWMFALVRTDVVAPKHRGLTYLLIPMDSVGIEIRPIRQLHGELGFAEVFLTDVRVPAANVLGEFGDGWRVAMTTLGFERGMALGNHVRFTRDVEDLARLAIAAGVADDPTVRDAIAHRFVEAQVFRRYMQHKLAQMAAGADLGPSASITKLYWSEMEARIFETAIEVLGPRAELHGAPAALGPEDFHRRYWHARAARIYAGTNEVQRNIIAERVLGLPKEPACT